ncbi:MAG: 3-dehydroquinate synthase [Actinobacteria bacterium]|nr:3-dehydroquinate synthase [Actinomycetota bacterium]MED5277318.1 3-dehydroquinate synthase family protein [Actinomycetota bacterium]|tara:strand:+ start:1278 stop:2282 length:1005 start_codon:yes stop_codon:yes gene_type:complete
MNEVQLELNSGVTYPVIVGNGVLDRLPSLLPAISNRAAIVTQKKIGVNIQTGIEQKIFEIDDGEEAKSLTTIEQLCSAFAQWGLTRADVVVGVGGGVVTDVAGFAAATYHRGVAVVHVATTLLAQIDAAVGGKTGVNLPEGKNLVGAFWQPSGVICDLDTLETLPEQELRSGLGELAKYHFLTGDLLSEMEMKDRIVRAVEIKAEIVNQDEKEQGKRALLNYGHTLGHAIESVGNYGIKHGEAVAIGLIYAAELAHTLGRIDNDRVLEHRRVIESYDLPTVVPSVIDDQDLLSAMTRDKKALDGYTFILDGPEGLEIVRGVEEISIKETLEKVR